MARLHARLCKYGAYISLEGYGSTIELYPQIKRLAAVLRPAFTARLQRQSTGPGTTGPIVRERTRLIHAVSETSTHPERERYG